MVTQGYDGHQMSDALTIKIAECRSELDDVDARLAMLTVERVRIETKLGAFEEALRIVQAEGKPQSKRSTSSSPEGIGRKLRPEWIDVLSHFGKVHPAPFNIDDIEEYVRGAGYPYTRGNIRSQMAQYHSRTFVERVGDGVFRLTERGFLAVGLDASTLSAPPPPPMIPGSLVPRIADPEMRRMIGDDADEAVSDAA